MLGSLQVQIQEDTRRESGAKTSVWTLWQRETGVQIEPQIRKRRWMDGGAQLTFLHCSALGLISWDADTYVQVVEFS